MSKRFVITSAFSTFVVAALIALTASPALAVKEFKDAFKAKYVKDSPTAANDVALAKAFQDAGCAVCHVGSSKKNRNAYGKELAKLLKKSDKKNKEKIDAALEKVSQMKSNPADANSPTFGEKIANGKLPAAE